MSGNAQLAQTGIPTLVVGGVAYPIGGWLALGAVLLVGIGLLCLRFGFRRNVAISQVETAQTGESTTDTPRRHRK